MEDNKPQAPKPQPEEEVKHGRLVKTLKRLEASEARKEDRAARRETYLVASGERDAALKLLEQRLGTSCERLESYLRCRFMVFDPKEIGKIEDQMLSRKRAATPPPGRADPGGKCGRLGGDLTTRMQG